MRSALLRLSPAAEIIIVVALGFGYFVLASITTYLSPAQTNTHLIDNASLVGLVLFEVVVFAALAIFLRVRGWTLSAIGLKPDVRQTLIGVALLIPVFALYAARTSLMPSTPIEGQARAALVAPDLSLATILTVSVVNAIYEEVLVCGYLISALIERHTLAFAIAASAALRGVYHLYQGPSAAITIGLLGVVFAVYYVWSGRLWPLIVAHGLLDFIAFTAYANIE